MIRLDVSVVFGRAEEHIAGCLESLLREPGADIDMRVTVVANEPGGQLADGLEREFPGVELVRNDRVRGFAENHNRVLRTSHADYALVLNDDVLIMPGSIAAAVAFMERPENSRVAALGPRLLNPDGSLQRSTYAYPTILRAWLSVSGLRGLLPFGAASDTLARLLGRGGGRSRFWAHDRTVDVDTFRGAFVLVRMSAVREVGVMDEASRVGVEEIEWHRRMTRAGWRVVFHPGVEVVHFGSRTIRLEPGLRNEYLKGFLNFFAKHRSRPAYRLFAAGAAKALWLRAAVLALAGRTDDARVARDGALIAWRGLLRP